MKQLVAVEFDALPDQMNPLEFRNLVEAYLAGARTNLADDPRYRVQEIADVRGRRCPYPVNRMNMVLSSFEPGKRLLLLTDDPVAKIDVRHALSTNGHHLRCAAYIDPLHAFLVEKGLGSHDPDGW